MRLKKKKKERKNAVLMFTVATWLSVRWGSKRSARDLVFFRLVLGSDEDRDVITIGIQLLVH